MLCNMLILSVAPGAVLWTRSSGVVQSFQTRAVIDAAQPYVWLKVYPLASGSSAAIKAQTTVKFDRLFGN
jgi:hypothetical protein